MAPRVRVVELDNGVVGGYYRVDSGSAAVCVAARGGSSFEPKGKYGLAHVVEHMLFKGNEYFAAGELDRLIELSGGEANAYTTREVIMLCAETVPESVVKAAGALALAIKASKLREDELEAEKKVIVAEARGYQSSPESQVFRLAAMSVWGDSHLGRPIEGYPETIESITLDDVVEYKARAFSPKRVAVAVVGGVGDAEALEAIKRFEGLEDGGALPEPPSVEPRPSRIVEDRGLEAAYVAVTLPLPSRYSLKPVLPRLRGVVFNLEAGATSILFKRLREEKPLAYSHVVDVHLTSWGGTLTIAALEVRRDRVEEAVGEIEEAVEEASKGGGGDGEWLAGRRRLYKFLTRREAVSNTERADNLAATLLLYREPITSEQLVEETLSSEWRLELPRERGVAIVM